MRADRLAAGNAAAMGIVATGLMLYPGLVLELIRLPEPSFPVLALTRTLGCVCLVLAVVLWTARAWLASPAAHSARRALAASYGVTAILLLAQQIAIWTNRAGLAAFVAFTGWAIAYWAATDAPYSHSAPTPTLQ